MQSNALAISAANLEETVASCLPRLRKVCAVMDTYGLPENAATLHDVVTVLEGALPSTEIRELPGELLVTGTTISRKQIAELLYTVFSAGPTWHRIVDLDAPSRFEFRANENFVLPHIDYPLNPGGALWVSCKDGESDPFLLNLGSIKAGLEVMATTCPRHFADLLGENADSTTAKAFLQCCLFGEVMDG